MKKFKKYKNPMQDGRRKLDPSLEKEIIQKYETGGYSWASLAREYGVSKRKIGFIVNPKTLEKVKARTKKHWQDYYDREYHKLAIRKYRAKKRKLNLTYTCDLMKPFKGNCEVCGKEFWTKNKQRKFCSGNCKSKNYRRKKTF
jgi:hypothetical protein